MVLVVLEVLVVLVVLLVLVVYTSSTNTNCHQHGTRYDLTAPPGFNIDSFNVRKLFNDLGGWGVWDMSANL